jgi:hypothetical protein
MGQAGLLAGAAVLVATVTVVAIKRRRLRRSSPEVIGIRNEDGSIDLMVLPRRLRAGESKLRVAKFPEGHSVVVEPGWSAEVTDRDIEEVLTVPDVVRLQLFGTRVSDGMLARIVDRHCSTLEILSVHSTSISDEGLSEIERCSRLVELTAGRTKITDRTLAQAARMHGLKRLLINHTRVSDQGFLQLRGLAALEVIAAGHCGLSDEALAVLPTLPKLKVAFLAGNRFSDSGLVRFREQFPGVAIEMDEDEEV